MIERRTIGLTIQAPNSAILRVWAPFVSSVFIKVRKNRFPLAKTERGYWHSGELQLAERDSYSIILDNHEYPDPASLYQPNGVHGKSEVFDTSHYVWKDDLWKGLSPSELIVYELHTGTFTDEGNFAGIMSKLDYLTNLGINCIEIMPVVQFPGSRNWGYDGVFPFAVQDSYGGPGNLQRLVDQCHQHGIAVILDVVYNHAGPEGNYLSFFGPYFTDKYKTPWGASVNFDDEWSDGVRDFYLENALMWLRDFHIDGLRLDAIHAIRDFSPKHILYELMEKIRDLNHFTQKSHFVIGESDLNDVRFIQPFQSGGYNLDAIWADEFHHALHALVTGEKNGYYSDFGKVDHLVKAYNDIFVYDGIWSGHRKKTFGTKTANFSGNNFVICSQNHDQIGNRMMGERLSMLVDHELLKTMAASVLFSPCIPLLFMGEEYAEKKPFLYFTSHGDEKLIEMVREGRSKEFKSFMNDSEPPDPQALNTFLQSKLSTSENSKWQKGIFLFYKELIRLRKTIPLWGNPDRKIFSAWNYNNSETIILERKMNEQRLLAILNFDKKAVSIPAMHENTGWKIVINSNEKQWEGPNHPFNPAGSCWVIPSQSAIILVSSNVMIDY